MTKPNVARHVAKKRKEGSSTLECEPQTLICGKDCVPKDPGHVIGGSVSFSARRCSDHPSRTQFKDVLLDVYM